jgi:hypothetical protein
MKILLLLLPLVLVSCGKENSLWPQKVQVQSVNPAEPELYSYELSTRRCSTGKHTFNTLAKACDALKNDQLNNDCAIEKREELFQSSCPGTFI